MVESVRSPGWYPDPDGGTGERWWNGVSWSDSRRGATGATTAAASTISAQAPIERVVYSAANPAPQSPAELGRPAPPLVVTRALNPAATTAIALATVSVFLNFLLIPSLGAIIFGVRAIARANQLAASGLPATSKTLAVVAIAVAVLSAIWTTVGFLVIFATGS